MGFTEASHGGIQSIVLRLDWFLSTVLGIVLYVAPDQIGDYVFQRKTDGVHWHLIRCVGGQLVATAFVNIRLSKSTPAAKSVCYLIRIISGIITVFLIYHCRSQTPTLVEPNVLEYVRVVEFGIIGLYVLFMFWNGWAVGNQFFPENRVGNFLYQLDCMASICIGLAWLTFPKWLLHRQVTVEMDESHEMVGRMMGAYFVATFCISQHALHWASAKDRKVVVESRAVCCAAILSAQLWSQKAYHNDWSGNHWVGISLFSIWTTLAVMYTLVAHASPSPRGKKTN
ncbi:hypothetical protein PRIPAC_74865 [Pristionchus pacificus]|uniref:Uncharacterized protein n=1 Tax=Pristionchus pacificus TaxID=54126 RepID=A0A454XT66_PRIPA|nr:hypothetical protein PRIPAC_74865 [Pristionchus pacificus]|eukprot:PDM64643.1 hypothetical protein PRIPAC_52899 [Pristionchus pacificus]